MTIKVELLCSDDNRSLDPPSSKKCTANHRDTTATAAKIFDTFYGVPPVVFFLLLQIYLGPDN